MHAKTNSNTCASAQVGLAVADGKAANTVQTNGVSANSAVPTAAPPSAPVPAQPARAQPAARQAVAPEPTPSAGSSAAAAAPQLAAPSPFAGAPALVEEDDDREPLQRAKPKRAKREYQGAPVPANEGERHEQLCKLGVLDSEPDPRFDDITKLVRAPSSRSYCI